VDLLADNDFAVQNTMIVGTDLKLMERVTGRKSWGRVLMNGVFSGMWMGLFIGLLFSLIQPQQFVLTLVSSILMGIVFFTIWSAISYAMSRGERDFTSMTATIPMQYELMVEHSHADKARQILQQAGANVPGPSGGVRPGAPVVPANPRSFGAPAGGGPAAGGGTAGSGPAGGPGTYGQPAQGPTSPSRTYGRPATPAAPSPEQPAAPAAPQQPGAPEQPAAPTPYQQYGTPQYGQPSGDQPSNEPHSPAAGSDDTDSPDQRN
jgi:hypothetical protein